MEEQKIDKRSKIYRESLIGSASANEDTPIEALLRTAIPVSKAEFHAAVNNSDNVPENYFSEKSDNPSRRAEMWITAGGNLLICFQKGKYFGVPAASVKYFNFK